jgi:ABC-type transporter Mla maintaining outer membrane lipid asymmetry permease subunit MlaE
MCVVWLPWLVVQVSEQVDSLRVLFTDPVDYLVTPRVLASMIAGPILNVLCFCMGEQHADAELTTR